MKKVFSFLLVVAVALVCCACGSGDKAESSQVKVRFLNGVWKCTALSDQLKKTYHTARMDIQGEDFTYTLKGDKTTLVFSGTTESIGSNCLALHVEQQKQTDTASGKVIKEESLPSDFSKSQTTILKPDGKNGMVAEAGGVTLHFEKDE